LLEVLSSARPSSCPTHAEDGEEAADAAPAPSLPPVIGSKRPAILADGTYATQAAVVEVAIVASAPSVPNLRALLLGGDFFLGGVIAGTLTKLVLRLNQLAALAPGAANRAGAEAMLFIASILRLGDSSSVPTPMDDDSRDRMTICLAILASPDEEAVQVGSSCQALRLGRVLPCLWLPVSSSCGGRRQACLPVAGAACPSGGRCRHAAANASAAPVQVWLEECRGAFAQMTQEKLSREAEEAKAADRQAAAQPDDLIDFHHLKARKGLSRIELEDSVTSDLARATGLAEAAEADSKRLNRVLQLTGAGRTAPRLAALQWKWLLRMLLRLCAALPPAGVGPIPAWPPTPAAPPPPARRLLRPCVRRGLRDGAPVRHRDGRDRHQPQQRDAPEPVPGAGHHGRPEAGGAAAELHTGARRHQGHPGQHQGAHRPALLQELGQPICLLRAT
jgi:hypothetical protein